MKLTETDSQSPRSWNKTDKEEKEMLSFVTQYQPLVSTKKKSFNGKAESHTKPTNTLNFAKFLKNHLLFPTRKENHGKDVKDQHTVSHRYRCAACHPLQFFTKNNLVRNWKR